MNSYKINLITPEKVLFEGEITSLKIMLSDGGMEVLAGHIPALAYINPGECRIILSDGSVKSFVSNDGVLNIEKETVTLTSDFLEWSENLSVALKKKADRIDAELQRRSASYVQHRLGSLSLIRNFLHKDTSQNI